MSAIAVIGAGPGLGQAIATRFGREGFDVALVARNPKKLERVRADLLSLGIRADSFVADVTDRAALGEALAAATARFGEIEVLEYSPAPSPDAAPAVDAVDMTIEAAAPEVEMYLYGGITAIQSVLPAMRERDRGTVIVSTGASSGPVVFPAFANIAAGSGALRNWTLNLHEALAKTGVYVAHVALAVDIGSGETGTAPQEIAERYWQLHGERTAPELVYGNLQQRS